MYIFYITFHLIQEECDFSYFKTRYSKHCYIPMVSFSQLLNAHLKRAILFHRSGIPIMIHIVIIIIISIIHKIKVHEFNKQNKLYLLENLPILGLGGNSGATPMSILLDFVYIVMLELIHLGRHMAQDKLIKCFPKQLGIQNTVKLTYIKCTALEPLT